MTTGNFTNGVMDGLWESFYENGNVFERGTLSNGIKEGLFEEFNENGAIKVNECFENGQKIKLINCNDI